MDTCLGGRSNLNPSTPLYSSHLVRKQGWSAKCPTKFKPNHQIGMKTDRSLLYNPWNYPTLTLLQWVTEKSNLMINARDRLGRSPLLVGLMSGAGPATVRELLAAGERIDLEDDVGRSPAQEGKIFLFLQGVRWEHQLQQILQFVVNFWSVQLYTNNDKILKWFKHIYSQLEALWVGVRVREYHPRWPGCPPLLWLRGGGDHPLGQQQGPRHGRGQGDPEGPGSGQAGQEHCFQYH